MKLAVVGTGTIVKKFLYAVPKTAFFQCVAVCSRQQESGTCFIESCRDLEGLDTGAMQVYTDYTAMLAEPEIELVYIALPNSLHYSYAKQALLAGKHVICEKPFTVEAKETEELIAIAKERKQFLFEAITTRNLPNYEIVKKALPKLGQIRMIQCNFSQYSSRYGEYLAGETPNVFHPDYAGGALNDLNIYNLHFVIGLFGKPEHLFYQANRGRKGIDLSGVAVLGYDGFEAVCVAAKDSDSPDFVLIQGEKGYLKIDGQSSRCQQITICVDGQTETYGEGQIEGNVLYYETMVFADTIRHGDYLGCWQKLEETKEVMEVLEGLRRSAR